MKDSLHAKVLKAISSHTRVRVKLSDGSLLGIAVGFGQQPVNLENKFERTLTLVLIEDFKVSLHEAIELPQTEVNEVAYSQIEDIEFL